jgi:hypothetical protein
MSRLRVFTFEEHTKQFIYLLLPLFFSGCISSSAMKYPQDWPQLDTFKEGECPDISGTYKDLSDRPPKEYSEYYDDRIWESSAPHSSGISLFTLLSSGELGAPVLLRDAGVVKIQQSADSIELTNDYITRCVPTGDKGGLKCGQHIPKQEHLAMELGRDYSCERDGILIDKALDAEFAVVPPFFVAAADSHLILTLRKAADRSLLASVQLKGGGVAVFVLIPYGGYMDNLEWWRWQEQRENTP